MVNDREERLEQILAEFKDGGDAAEDTVDTAAPAPQNDAAGQSDVADETAPESEAESEAPIEIEPVPVQRRRQHAEPKDGEREKPKFSGMRLLLLAAGFLAIAYLALRPARRKAHAKSRAEDNPSGVTATSDEVCEHLADAGCR